MQNSSEVSVIKEFIAKHNLKVEAMENCARESSRIRKTLKEFYTTRPSSPDVDLVVFGSIARNECTLESDVDWTLLIDGQANASHLTLANTITKKIKEA